MGCVRNGENGRGWRLYIAAGEGRVCLFEGAWRMASVPLQRGVRSTGTLTGTKGGLLGREHAWMQSLLDLS
jgi:hypothetical protein